MLFLGSGTSRTLGMPGWADLLGDLAAIAGLHSVELAQFNRLALKDQASLCSTTLAKPWPDPSP